MTRHQRARPVHKKAPLPQPIAQEEALKILAAPPDNFQPLQKVDRICKLQLIWDPAAGAWLYFIDGLATYTDNGLRAATGEAGPLLTEPSNPEPPMNHPLETVPARMVPGLDKLAREKLATAKA